MFFVVLVLTILTVMLLHLKSGHPTPLYLGLNVVYSLGAAMLGGWVAARIGRIMPIAHVIALALLMLAFGVFLLRHPAPGQPYGYLVFLVVAPPLVAIAGAALASRRSLA